MVQEVTAQRIFMVLQARNFAGIAGEASLDGEGTRWD